MFAVGELEIRRGFVTDFEPFEVNNADVLVAAFPDLALLKFHEIVNDYLIFIRCPESNFHKSTTHSLSQAEELLG